MWLFHCVILGFCFVVHSKLVDEQVKEIINPDNSELTFHEIIKNISKVNNVMKDLLKNFKNLKELCESDFSKENKHAHDSIEERKINHNNDPNFVTRMYFSEASGEKSSIQTNVNENQEKGTDADTSKEKSTEKLIENKTENDEKKEDTSLPFFDETNAGEGNILNNDKVLKHRDYGKSKLAKPKGASGTGDQKTKPKGSYISYRDFRRVPKQPALLITTNSSVFNQSYNYLIDKKDDNAFINSEQFKTDILRSTFSDACLKLVIRKCFQAGKKVLKTVCHQYNCNKYFRSTYKTNEKRGCIKYFEGEKKDNSFRAGKDVGNEDFTRGGYLAASCFPYKKSKTEMNPKRIKGKTQKLNTDNKTKKPTHLREQNGLRVDEMRTALKTETITALGFTIEDSKNILRDRLEKACQEISASKCKKACNFAYTEACKTRPICNSGKKRYFKKECSKQCKKSFGIRGSDSSSSSSSSSSESKIDD